MRLVSLLHIYIKYTLNIENIDTLKYSLKIKQKHRCRHRYGEIICLFLWLKKKLVEIIPQIIGKSFICIIAQQSVMAWDGDDAQYSTDVRVFVLQKHKSKSSHAKLCDSCSSFLRCRINVDPKKSRNQL